MERAHSRTHSQECKTILRGPVLRYASQSSLSYTETAFTRRYYANQQKSKDESCFLLARCPVRPRSILRKLSHLFSVSKRSQRQFDAGQDRQGACCRWRSLSQFDLTPPRYSRVASGVNPSVDSGVSRRTQTICPKGILQH